MQGMQQVYNSRMEPIQSHEDYPKYARSSTKPVARARQIIDNGVLSDHPCSICVELEQDCFRWEGAYGKCAYCTSKDKKQELCHLPGQEASPAPERRKRRKITGNIYAPGGYAASNADTMMSGTHVSDTLASGPTPFPSAIPMSGTRNVRKRADPVSAMTETIDIRVSPPSVSETGSQATLERITALENQVSTLEAKVVELLVKLEEVSSCVSTTSTTPRPQAAAGASSTLSSTTFEDLQAQHLPDAPPPPAGVPIAVRRATIEWVEGPKTPELPDASSSVQIATSVEAEEPKLPDASVPMHVAASERVEEPKTSPTPGHTFEHPEGYRPVNCICATSG